MNKLFEIIDDNTGDFHFICRRDAVRAIILKETKLALLYSKKEGYYKFPGGGINPEESLEHALFREILEECGKYIDVSSMQPFGFVKERYKSQVVENELFESISYYYLVRFEKGSYASQMDEYEKKQELSFAFYKIDDAIDANQMYWKKTGSKMILRELKILLLLKEIYFKS